MQPGQDAGIARLGSTREHGLSGRVGEDGLAVRPAHDDTIAHGPDDGVELCRPSVLGLRESSEPALHLLSLADVAGDRDGRRWLAGQVDSLKQDLRRHGWRSVAHEVERDRARLGTTLPDGADDPRQAVLSLLDKVRKAATGELVGGPPEQDAGAVIGALDDLGRWFEDEDGLRDRVEDLPESVGRLERAGILDGGTGPCREVDCERDMSRLERATAFRGGESDRAQHPPGDRHRGAHPRVKLQSPEQLPVPVVAGGGCDRRLVDDRDDHGLARAGDRVRSDVGVRVGRIPGAKLLHETDPVRVAMGQRERDQLTLGIQHVDGAPICDAGDDQIGDLPQRRRAVERGSEDPAGIGQERGECHVVLVEEHVTARRDIGRQRAGAIIRLVGDRR